MIKLKEEYGILTKQFVNTIGLFYEPLIIITILQDKITDEDFTYNINC